MIAIKMVLGFRVEVLIVWKSVKLVNKILIFDRLLLLICYSPGRQSQLERRKPWHFSIPGTSLWWTMFRRTNFSSTTWRRAGLPSPPSSTWRLPMSLSQTSMTASPSLSSSSEDITFWSSSSLSSSSSAYGRNLQNLGTFCKECLGFVWGHL